MSGLRDEEADDSLPSFVSAIQNVTVSVGRDARLSCVVENLGDYRVSHQRLERMKKAIGKEEATGWKENWLQSEKREGYRVKEMVEAEKEGYKLK
ncbi:hypothetical protein O3P69_007219 [Scylla paramamosain]|uniref:Uncharacterized protein n=1 Tax=Scylla paramamosain TaxID=85552 RepID=A0AAW0V2W6_SCYPA